MREVWSVSGDDMTNPCGGINGYPHVYRLFVGAEYQTAWIRAVRWIGFNNLTAQDCIQDLAA
jgi:hypothetical protein